ncbi:MAG TPA: hypothetical protein VIU82_05055 [Bosea sp. (in: a-proteobacteria)]
MDADYARVAESLVPGSAEFLREEHVSALARAEITEEQVKREIAAQKLFFKRLAPLLPGLLRHFRFDQPSEVLEALARIDDCHRDFSIIEKAQRRDKARRLAVQKLSAAKRAMDKAATALSRVDSIVSMDYERLRSAHLRARKARSFSISGTSDMVHEIELCSAAIEVCAWRAEQEDDYLILSNSGTSTHVVEAAFALSIWYNGPPLVTTPGSDFSAVCSIIYEIASGCADESLAGAINRFARSEDKQRFLAEEEQLRIENEDTSVPDNFRAVTSDIARAREDIELYGQLAAMPSLSLTAGMLANSMVRDAEARINAARRKYGPNLLWAHQIPHEHWESVETARQALKQKAILLGELRRAVLEVDRP